MIRARFLAAILAASLTAAVAAQTKPEYGDEVFQPSVGQPGKDVIWVPTPDALVTRMLTAAKVTKDDLVYDLGSGDGKIPIAAAKQFGAKAVGIEYNPDMAELARRNTKRQGVDNMVTIITGDIFKEDFSKATVVTMYLLPDLNLKLRPTILKMKPGTRVTSHQFHMGDWDPDEKYSIEFRDAYLWYVPANVEGTWTFKEESGKLGRRQRLAGAALPARRRDGDRRRQDAADPRRRAAGRQAVVQLRRQREQPAHRARDRGRQCVQRRSEHGRAGRRRSPAASASRRCKRRAGTTSTDAPQPLLRRIDAIAIIVGIVVGAGIFKTPVAGRGRDRRCRLGDRRLGLRRAGVARRRALLRRARDDLSARRRRLSLPHARLGPARRASSTRGRARR